MLTTYAQDLQIETVALVPSVLNESYGHFGLSDQPGEKMRLVDVGDAEMTDLSLRVKRFEGLVSF